MQNLLKFALLTLIFLTTLNSSEATFPENSLSGSRNNSYPKSSDVRTDISVSFFQDYVKINKLVFKVDSTSTPYFNIANLKYIGWSYHNNHQTFNNKHALYYYDSSFEKKSIVCLYDEQSKSLGNCSYSYKEEEGYKKITMSYYKSYYLSGPIATCETDENFNTETKQCQSCPEGYSWNPATNKCYKDCTDVNKNKWGWTDGTCTDCSKETTHADIRRCYCKYFGLGIKPFSVKTKDPKTGLYIGFCSDDSEFWYKDPADPEIPKPDNNNTTPSNPGGGNTTPGGPGGGNGGPGGGNGGPGGGNGNDGNNNEPGGGGPSGDNEFCKKNPNDPKCKGPGGDNEFCKKNPKDPRCKGPGGGGPSGNFDPDDNKDKDAKFDPKDFDFKDLEKDVNDFKSKYSDALDTVYNSFTNTKQGIEQFIANVQGKGMNGITKKNVPTTCPRIYTINFNGYPSELNFDFCKVVSPASGAFYHLFYVIFFLGFLMLIVKLLILSF